MLEIDDPWVNIEDKEVLTRFFGRSAPSTGAETFAEVSI
jgi:hypothetical protein